MRKQHLALVLGVALCCSIGGFIACNEQGNAPSSPARANNDGGKGSQPLTVENCVTMNMCTLCPIGGASVVSSEGGVLVGHMGAESDGVSSTFHPTNQWSRDCEVVLDDYVNDVMLYSAVSHGEETSSLEVRQSGDHLDFSPNFRAGEGEEATYAVQVMSGGQEAYAMISNNATGLSVLDLNPLLRWYVEHPFGFHYEFVSMPTGGGNNGDGSEGHPSLTFFEGACQWTVGFAEVQNIRLSNGTVVSGDGVVITEMTSPGHYIYHNFDQINMTGHVASMRISRELTNP